ncbi:MAG: hypothetical protein KF791_19770 [Verrucomicrobiae bacterium]|nr:hypothetical protein [Verrucomicrobiae bacterium]
MPAGGALGGGRGLRCGRDGVSRVSRQPGLGDHRLRRITAAQTHVEPAGTPMIRFVELTRPPAVAAAADGYRIALEDGGRPSPRVELDGERL